MRVTRKVSLKLLTHLQGNPEGTVAAYKVTRKFSFKSRSASALVVWRAGNVTFSNFLFYSDILEILHLNMWQNPLCHTLVCMYRASLKKKPNPENFDLCTLSAIKNYSNTQSVRHFLLVKSELLWYGDLWPCINLLSKQKNSPCELLY